jgi:glycosyltransferase involved in cell wall biosynthesis
MMLGSDVSSLTTTAKTAAAQGLSIVVPVYNEAAGLAALHQRLIDLAKSLRARYGLPCEVVYVDDGSADSTLAITRGLPADGLDLQVVSLSRCCSWTVTASIRPRWWSSWSRTGSMTATTSSTRRRHIATMNRRSDGWPGAASTR